jgi:hypothetical protein
MKKNGKEIAGRQHWAGNGRRVRNEKSCILINIFSFFMIMLI